LLKLYRRGQRASHSQRMPGRLPVLALAALFACTYALAQAPDPDPGRFKQEIDSFAAWDRKNSPPPNAVLFVGSSSIRFWATAEAFPGQAVVNRGFGGSELSDVLHFYDQLIARYSPARVVLYAGDNDIASGKSVTQVFDDYLELVQRIRGDFPEAEILFISIKPSRARWDQWPAMATANTRIREYTMSHPKLVYVDLASPLLDDNGQPGDVYIADGLHLNERGYHLWQQHLAPYLK
jgi:lysophospholipase L1-like esterase